MWITAGSSSGQARPAATTPLERLARNAARAPRRTAMLRPFYSRWEPVTLGDLLDRARQVGKGLAAAGIRPGDRVALWAGPSELRIAARYAIWQAGAISVELGDWWSADDVEHAISETGAAGVLAEPGLVAAIDGRLLRLPNVRRIWTLDEAGLHGLAELGDIVGDDDIDGRPAGAREVALVAYTMGTTGQPRGCMLTHGALANQAQQLVAGAPRLFSADEVALLAAPAGHCVEIAAALACLHAGTPFAVAPDFGSLRPTAVIGLPELVGAALPQRPSSAWRQLTWALPPALRGESELGRLRHVLLGGPRADDRLVDRLVRAGVEVRDGYALTQAGGFVALTEPGSPGAEPLPDTAIRISADGAMEVRGPSVFAGYWNDPASSEAALCSDEWLRTGDAGSLDSAGLLHVIGRRNELVAVGQGRMTNPRLLEQRVQQHPLVERCWVTPRPDGALLAVVTVDRAQYELWLRRRGRPADGDCVTDPDLRATLCSLAAAVNKSFPKALHIGGVAVVADTWTEQGGELSPAGELRRHVLERRYRPANRPGTSRRAELRLPETRGAPPQRSPAALGEPARSGPRP